MPNWLELADAEFSKTCGRGTAKTAKTLVSSVTAVPHPAIFRKKKVQPARTVENSEQAKLEAHKDFPGTHHAKTLSCDLEAGEIVAVEIASEVLGADIWFSFRDDFDPQDGKAVFYADELEFLRTKTPEDLRGIHKIKVAYGPGYRVRQ